MTTTGPILDLGTLSGPVLLFGGAYGNLQALQALQALAAVEHFPPGQVFFTGDMAGYCAQPVECIELLQQWGVRGIAGNVELQLGSGAEDCGCNFNSEGRCDLFSRNWYAYTRAQVTQREKAWMQELPFHIGFRLNGKKVLMVHGSPDKTAGYVFASTPWTVKREYLERTGADIIVGGHAGLPFAQRGEGGWWINAGAIGMPANDGTDRVWCAALQVTGDGVQVRFMPFRYGSDETVRLMHLQGLPSSYAQTLKTGIWDNCEILPEWEARRQGQPLSAEALIHQADELFQ